MELKIKSTNRKLWVTILIISFLMAFCIIMALYNASEFFSSSVKAILIASFIFTMFLGIAGIFIALGSNSYYMIKRDTKEILYYEEFYKNISIKPVAKFDEIDRIEIQMEETYETGGDGPSYYKNVFWIALILKTKEQILLTEYLAELADTEKLISKMNISRMGMNLNSDLVNLLYEQSFYKREDLIYYLTNNLNFTKEETVKLLYSPPEELISKGKAISELTGSTFLPFGYFKFHDRFFDCDKDKLNELYENNISHKSEQNIEIKNKFSHSTNINYKEELGLLLEKQKMKQKGALLMGVFLIDIILLIFALITSGDMKYIYFLFFVMTTLLGIIGYFKKSKK